MARDQSDASALASGGPTSRSTAHIVLIAATAALGGFLFGFDTAIINGAVSAIGSHFHAGALLLGQAVASALLGSAVGAFFAGRWADRLGRIPVMVIAAILFFISAIGSGLAFSLWELTLFRLVGGLGVGTASVIAPAYIAEIAPADLRGRLGSLQQLAIVSGIFIALLLDYFFATAAGNSLHVLWLGLAAWRWMFLSGCVPAAIYGCLALSIPESPRFLVAKMRDPEAIKVLDMVVGSSEAEHKLEEIRATLGSKQSRSLRDLRGPALGLLPIVWIGIILSALQQFVGINVIFYYSSVLWQAVGFSEKDSLVITVITSVTNIVTTLVAIALVDKIGRKALLLIGSSGMVLTLGTMALAFGTAPALHGEPHLGPLAGPIALFAANAYVFFFGMSWGPVVWVLLGEMFNNRIRAIALSVAATAQWIANWIVSVSFPSLKDVGLGFAYGLYTTAAVISLFFVMKWVKETKGRELESM